MIEFRALNKNIFIHGKCYLGNNLLSIYNLAFTNKQENIFSH
jgi:hypothetical protein